MLSPGLLYPLLFVTALFAGMVDAIAGGGGLITVPVLLATGMPPRMALGTNKFQSSFGSFTAMRHYTRTGHADIKAARAGLIATAIGAALGAFTVQQVSSDFLNKAIPVLLIGIAIYTILTPRFGHMEAHARVRRGTFYVAGGLALGWYDGFFGPGAGSFWAMAFVLLQGMNLMRATASTKAMNFTSNIVSLAVFVIGGSVMFVAGLCMAVGQVIGARIGAELAVRRGAAFIRPVFIAVVLALAGKLMWDRWL